MDVTLKLQASLEDALPLADHLDGYIAEATQEWRDTPPPAGTGARLLERALGMEGGLVLTAHLEGGERIGYCVVGPLIDPLVGDHRPMILALWVDPSWRHRGLARALVDRVHAELGPAVLGARAAHNDDALISMGERWGFVRSFEVMFHEP